MKPLFPGLIAALLVASPVTAQDVVKAPVSRADVHFVAGWQNIRSEDQSDLPYRNEWMNSILQGSIGAGWYWTDHHKTQIDFGGSTKANHYTSRPVTISGTTTYESSNVERFERNVSFSQHYQFFRNQWFHPNVAAGVEIARATTTEHYPPVFVYDNVTRTSREVQPARVEGPNHETIVRPFVQTGFKAYMTRKAFFLTDVRVMVRGGIDEVLFRFGIGVDF